MRALKIIALTVPAALVLTLGVLLLVTAAPAPAAPAVAAAPAAPPPTIVAPPPVATPAPEPTKPTTPVPKPKADTGKGCGQRAVTAGKYNPACKEYQGYLDPGSAAGRGKTSGDTQAEWQAQQPKPKAWTLEQQQEYALSQCQKTTGMTRAQCVADFAAGNAN